MELGKGVSLSTLRAELHQKYGTLSTLLLFDCKIDTGQGDIIRISPNEVDSASHSEGLGSFALFFTAPLCETDGVQ
jgi:hypothetical protein